jgi:hypothetical protein
MAGETGEGGSIATVSVFILRGIERYYIIPSETLKVIP